MQPIFDERWRKRALAGDAAAVRLLAREALEPLHMFCLPRVGGDRDLCEEVVQETLLGAIDGLHRYEPGRSGGHVLPWLAGLARNVIRTVLAREKASLSVQAVWENLDRDLLRLYSRLHAEPASEDLLLREETRQLVNAAMSQLPPHYRQSLEAKYIDGCSVRDIAGLLSMSEKAVESLLTRARETFRTAFMALTRNLEAELP